jgi:hypothetical protein
VKETSVAKTALLANTAQQLVVRVKIVLQAKQVHRAKHWNQIAQPVKWVCTVVVDQHAQIVQKDTKVWVQM